MRKKITLFGLSMVALAPACGALFPLDGYADGPNDGAVDAAIDATGPTDGDAAACGTKPPARRPSTAADVAGDVVFAIDAIELVDPAISAKGYDLDGRCTTDERTSLCKPSDQREVIRDLAGGVDNGGFPIFALPSLRSRPPIAQGAYGLVVVVRKWNGTADDPAVEVLVYNSPGTKAALKKDGTDTLPIVNEVAGASLVAAYRADDSKAYVTGGTLVAYLDPEPLDSGPAYDDFNFNQTAIALDKLRVPFWTAVLTAKIEGTGPAQRLTEGVLAGVVYGDELLSSLPLVVDPSAPADAGNSYICADSAKFREARDKICSRLDITDVDAVSDVCDHTSVVLSLSAVAAKIGATVAPSYVSGCPRQGTQLPIEACP